MRLRDAHFVGEALGIISFLSIRLYFMPSRSADNTLPRHYRISAVFSLAPTYRQSYRRSGRILFRRRVLPPPQPNGYPHHYQSPLEFQHHSHDSKRKQS